MQPRVRQPYELVRGCGVACDTLPLATPETPSQILESWNCGSGREGGREGEGPSLSVRLRARTAGKREGGERAGDLALVSVSQRS